MMKIKSIVFWSLIALVAGCTRGEENNAIIEETLPSELRTITFEGGTEGVSVLIFRKNGDNFYYVDNISNGWSEGKAKANLKLGDYKFLFFKHPGISTLTLPNLSPDVSEIGDVNFSAYDDSEHNGYVLPVDEVWMPETGVSSSKIYTITGGDTIRDTLTRAVSQVTMTLKRGMPANGSYTEIPFDAGNSIMDEIDSIFLNISGVGKTLHEAGTKDSVNTFYAVQQADSLTDSGYAFINGPYVLPSEKSGDSKIEIILKPKAESALEEMKAVVYGPLERNKKLEITLWVTSTYKFINVIVDLSPISAEMDGDTGVWN